MRTAVEKRTRLRRASFTLTVALLAGVSSVAGQQAAGQQAATPARPPSRFVHPEAIAFDDHAGWTQIFDGTTMKDWDGPSEVWHVEDGSLVGESSAEKPSGTTNLIWTGMEPQNFRLKLEMKLEGNGANGGVQYRSHRVAPTVRSIPPDATPEMKQRMEQGQALAKRHAQWNMTGYQMDFDYANRYSGQLYEQDSPRGIVAWRGDVVATEQGKKPTLLATLGDSDALKAFIKPGEWNQVEIVADGNCLTHIINGHVMAVLLDTDVKWAQAKGLIALEIEGGGTLKISHRNIWLMKLP